MDNRKSIVVGIDFCNDFSQVSYYNSIENEPVSVDFSGVDNKYHIPTIISKTPGRDVWYAGDEAKNCAALGDAVLVDNLIGKALERNPVIVDEMSMMPMELIKVFMDALLQSVKIASGVEQISMICITLEQYHISLLNVLSEVMNLLGYPKDKVMFASHTESFIYYAMNQKKELWQNDVVLFDYGRKGLVCNRMYISNYRGSKLVMTHEDNLCEEVPYELVNNTAAKEFMDSRLLEYARKLYDKKNISTFYLTGTGFSEGFEAPEFIKYICNRHRAFAGQNLYVKGACYQAAESAGRNVMKEYLLACPERITTGIELKIQDRGRDKILRMVRPGVNWYGADCSYDLIVDEAPELEIFLSPIDTMEKQLVRVPLTDFPTRPAKATRITLKLSFTSDSRCHLMVIDKGFGEFFAGSGRIINEELLL